MTDDTLTEPFQILIDLSVEFSEVHHRNSDFDKFNNNNNFI